MIGGEFIPEGDDGMGQIMIRMPWGQILTKPTGWFRIEKKIISIPEMEGVAVIIGRIDDGGEREPVMSMRHRSFSVWYLLRRGCVPLNR